VLLGVATVASIATSAMASTPVPNSAIVLERLYNDCPISTVTHTNAYPGSINIHDTWDALCVGFANGHAWNFSGDGGATSLDFGNNGNYKFKAVVILNANSGVVEGGIHIAPWWNNMDGRFQARIPDGEVACFGGRFPFYSFTANFGVVYVAGTPITMELDYLANGLSSVSPATIEYKLTYGPNSYTSGPLAFDQGNPLEDPPHGQWGALDPALAGGVVQVNNGSGGSEYDATWTDVVWTSLDPVVPTKNESWGKLKVLYR
jgi:hypothetical protein